MSDMYNIRDLGNDVWEVRDSNMAITDCKGEDSADALVSTLRHKDSETEALRQQLAAAQAERDDATQVQKALMKDVAKLELIIQDKNTDLAAAQARITELEAHIERVEKARDWWKNKSLYGVSPSDTPASETEAQSVKAIKERLAKISREAGLRLYGDTPASETVVNRCPNCGEIFGEPEDGLLTCTNCGLIQTKEN